VAYAAATTLAGISKVALDEECQIGLAGDWHISQYKSSIGHTVGACFSGVHHATRQGNYIRCETSVQQHTCAQPSCAAGTRILSH
jgi:hypothetical protein